ncbi:MAG: alpha/beta hydrolase, partial [Bacteroidota bacterium]
EVFGKVGIFSPSYWFTEEVFAQTSNTPVPKDTRLYLLVGGKEGEDMVSNTQRMHQQILQTGHPEANLELIVDPEGEHNEAFWNKHFKEVVRWLYGV